MIFKHSRHAHKWLDGLVGIEVGGSSHNPFGLNTINVDYTDSMATEFKLAEKHEAGWALPVDIVADGASIPVPDKSYDFVVSSHVIEHFYDPIDALMEWHRIAKKYIYIICPQPNALPSDRPKPLTPLEEIIERHNDIEKENKYNEHHSRWNYKTFVEMCECFGFNVIDGLDPDDKVGNGFTVVIQV